MDTAIINDIHPFKSDGKWGYKDNNQIFIEPQYHGAMPIADGLCWVKAVGWGAVDINNSPIIPFVYKHINRIAKNRFIVCNLRNKYGLIDNTGHVIIELKYDTISIVADNILEVSENDIIHYYDFEGAPIFDFVTEPILMIYNESNEITNISTKDNEYFIRKDNSFLSLKNGLFKDSNDNYVVLYDGKNNRIEVYDNKWGLLLVLTDSVLNLNVIQDNIVYLPSETRCLTFIDIKTGQKRIVCNNITEFIVLNQDFIRVSNENGFAGILNSQGDIVIPMIYSGLGCKLYFKEVLADYLEDIYIAATKDGKSYGIIDMAQNVIVPFKYKSIEDSGISSIKSCLVNDGDLWGVIDLDNNSLIECKYQQLSTFSCGLAVAKLNNYFGVINEDDKIVIPFVYNNITSLSNGYFIATQKGTDYILDQYGNITFENRVDTIKSYYDAKDIVKIISQEYWGSVDLYGEEVIPCVIQTKNFHDYYHVNDIHLPCYVWTKTFSIKTEKLNEAKNFLHLENLTNLYKEKEFIYNDEEEYRHSYSYIDWAHQDDLDDSYYIIEYQGYYIINKKVDQEISFACIISPCGRLLHTFNHSAWSFESSTDDYITISDWISPRWHKETAIIINKRTEDLQETFIPVDNSSLYKVKIGTNYGIANNKKELLLPIEYCDISILGNVAALLISDTIILWHAEKGFICQTNLYRWGDEELQSIDSMHIYSKCQRLIVNSLGKIMADHVESMKEYESLWVIKFYNDNYEDIPIEYRNDYYDDQGLCNEDFNSYLGLYNKAFEQLCPGEFYCEIRICDGDLLLAHNNKKYVLFNSKGVKLFETSQYTKIHDFHEGLAVVEQECKCGVIDTAGKVIVPCMYYNISDFENGIATTYMYGTKINITKDGNVHSILHGNVCEGVYCYIFYDQLYFVDENEAPIKDFLKNYNNDFLIVAYDNGLYTIFDDGCGEIKEKLFFVNKSGHIISYKTASGVVRISNNCILYGQDSLTMQNVPTSPLCSITNCHESCKSFFIFSDGTEIKYYSSIDTNTHFLYNDKYIVFDNDQGELWNSDESMYIQSIGDNYYRIISSSRYEPENEENNYYPKHQTKIITWDNKTKVVSTTFIPCYTGINNKEIITSPNENYLILPLKAYSYCGDYPGTHLLILNKFNGISFVGYVGRKEIEKVYNDKILLANYKLEPQDEDYSDMDIRLVGYILLSMKGETIGYGVNNRFFIIGKTPSAYSGDSIDFSSSETGVYNLEKDEILVPTEYSSCKIIEESREKNYIIVKNEDDKYGFYYNSNKILDCEYKDISRFTIPIEEQTWYGVQKTKLRTEYFIFQDFDGNKGLIYKGKVIRHIENCEIESITYYPSQDPREGRETVLVYHNDKIDIFHKDRLIVTCDKCEVQLFRVEEDKYYFKLKDGTRQGIVCDTGWIIPMDLHIISWDSLNKNWHICVYGDRVYENDGSTIFLGNDNETLVSLCFCGSTCHAYAFWNEKEKCFKFYDENRNLMEFSNKHNSELGSFARLKSIYDKVFSYSKKSFVDAPDLKKDEEPEKDINDYDSEPDVDWDRETYYALGGDDYDEWRENGGNIDSMMDEMGF